MFFFFFYVNISSRWYEYMEEQRQKLICLNIYDILFLFLHRNEREDLVRNLFKNELLHLSKPEISKI